MWRMLADGTYDLWEYKGGGGNGALIFVALMLLWFFIHTEAEKDKNRHE